MYISYFISFMYQTNSSMYPDKTFYPDNIILLWNKKIEINEDLRMLQERIEKLNEVSNVKIINFKEI